jgi:hypothetical protein
MTRDVKMLVNFIVNRGVFEYSGKTDRCLAKETRRALAYKLETARRSRHAPPKS